MVPRTSGSKAPLVQPRQENVKMFLQADTSTPVVQVLAATDQITLVRRHDREWDLVTVNGKAGYVFRSGIAALKLKSATGAW